MPHENLTHVNFKVLYRNKKYILTTPQYCRNENLELIQNTILIKVFLIKVEKKHKLFCRPKKTFSVFEGAILNSLKLFFGKMKNSCSFLNALQ